MTFTEWLTELYYHSPLAVEVLMACDSEQVDYADAEDLEQTMELQI